MFFEMVLSAWVLATLYVSWRAASVPWVARRVSGWSVLAIVLLPAFAVVVAAPVRRAGWLLVAHILELIGVTWMGVLFLLLVALLAADVLTGFGLLFRRHAPVVRGWALVAGTVLAAVALVQGLRPPVVREFEIGVAGLPSASDNTTLVFISDLHAGTLAGRDWLAARIAQVSALHPDAIVIGGDVLEGDDESERELLPELGRLSAPLGVWAVAGNHEYHGRGGVLDALEAERIHVLRNQWKEIRPGLVIAGVEQARGHGAPESDGRDIDRVLAGKPREATTVLVSHVPVHVERAARAGVGLMLAGHTHDGQIWPFRYLVGLRFPYLAGRYDVNGMPLLVCRGTGTFGPRMRLWYPSEIVRVRLRTREPLQSPRVAGDR